MSKLNEVAKKIGPTALGAAIAAAAMAEQRQAAEEHSFIPRRHRPAGPAERAYRFAEAAIRHEAALIGICAMLPGGEQEMEQVRTAVDKFGYGLVRDFVRVEGRLPKDRDDLIASSARLWGG